MDDHGRLGGRGEGAREQIGEGWMRTSRRIDHWHRVVSYIMELDKRGTENVFQLNSWGLPVRFCSKLHL